MNNNSSINVGINAGSDITAEACAWIAQLESGDLSGADLAALREWISRSPAHKQELREVAAFSGQLSIFTELAEPLAVAAGRNSVLRRPAWRRIFGAPAMAAGVTAFAVAIAVIAFLPFNSPSPSIYRTAVGEYQALELTDGTTVQLNTDSQIEVDYRESERRVRLIYGEVLFDVTSNPSRPFVVYSNAAVAEAVGTSFVVRLRNSVTELAVVEGVVAFSRLAGTLQEPSLDVQTDQAPGAAKQTDIAPPRVLVRAGQTLSSSAIPDDHKAADAIIPTITQRDIQRKLSWTEGLLDFSETPLEEVIAEVTRHNNVSIEIEDPELKKLTFGGMFRTGDVDPLLEALAGLDIEVVRLENDRILLRKANDR